MGHLEVTKALLHSGVLIEATDNAMYTPLWLAAYYGKLKCKSTRVA